MEQSRKLLVFYLLHHISFLPSKNSYRSFCSSLHLWPCTVHRECHQLHLSGVHILGLASWLLLLFGFVAFSTILRYGYYRDSRLVLGPSSSRLMKASSIFVNQIEVESECANQVLLFAFNDKPELSSRANWSSSNFFVVGAYSSNGFPLWLNKGSSIRMRWEAQMNTLNQLQGIVIKGERKFETLQPKQTLSPDEIVVGHPTNGKEAEYIIEKDDRYHIGVLNMNSRNTIITMHVNVSAMVYDTTRAEKMCSTAKGSCRLSLLFPQTHYIILTAPENGDLGGWFIQVSFMARVLTYIALLGFIVVVICLILKYLGACDGENRIHNTTVMVDTYNRTSTVVPAQEVTETAPMMQVKSSRLTYGTNEEDDDEESGASSSSSEDLYDEKLCVICYDEQRNCFFIPCGHCATCYDCAQRIMEVESKVCPICRRLIHKVRRLFNS